MSDQTQPYIDLRTLSLVMPGRNAFTGEQWREMVWPPCPKCGETIDVDRVDVTERQELVRHYIPGRWECPNECDPRSLSA